MTTHLMALTNIPLTKAFLFHYENAQSSDKPRYAKPRIEQHSIAKRIIAPTINIAPPLNILPPLINIQVKTATGKLIIVKINPADTILQLKKKIYLAEDISIESQRIVYAGKQLEDKYTLSHYNITNECVVHIIIRLRGGMFHHSSSRADWVSLNYQNKMDRGLSMLDYMKHESSREMFAVLDEYEEMLKTTRNDTEIDMVYDLIHKIYVD